MSRQARRAIGERALVCGAVEVWITEFGEGRRKDRDNTAKPIQDALQGVLFADDRQVMHLRSEWCDINDKYIVRYMSPAVATAFSAGHEFVWVRVLEHHPRDTLRA